MARPQGVRNAAFSQKRADLLAALTQHALDTDIRAASLRQFAMAAGVSEPTIRHYFGDREQVVEAVMNHIAERGRPFIELASQPADTLERSIQEYLDIALAGVAHGGFARAHAFGLSEGLNNETLGRAYLGTLLEPSLSAIEARLRTHAGGAQANSVTLRAAALAILGSLLLGAIHQNLLGGSAMYPLDFEQALRSVGAMIETGLRAQTSSTEG